MGNGTIRNTQGDDRLGGRKGAPAARSGGPGRPVGSPGSRPTPFSQRVRHGFQTWDRGGDGRLSRDDLDRAMENPFVQREGAAAVATLRDRYDQLSGLSDEGWGHEGDGITLSDLARYEQQAWDGPGSAYEGEYGNRLDDLAGPRGTLFDDSGPDASSVRQGNIGDCYFVAAAISAASGDPDRLRSMVQDNFDGTSTVSFPGREPLTVPALTDSERAFYGTRSDGDWMAMLEKGWGLERNRSRGAEATVVPQDATRSGTVFEGIEALSGRPADTDLLRTTELDATRDKLEAAMQGGSMVTAGINPRPIPMVQPLPGLSDRHAYAVVGFDREVDTVTLRDPNGWLEPEDAQGQPLDGRRDGEFGVFTGQFRDNFDTASYEQRAAEPAPPSFGTDSVESAGFGADSVESTGFDWSFGLW